MASRYLDGPQRSHRVNPHLVEALADALAAELAAGAPGPRWDARVLSLRAMTGDDEHETLAELLGRARRMVDAQDFAGGPSDPIGGLALMEEPDDEERARLIEAAAVAMLEGSPEGIARAQDALADAGHGDVEEADIRFAAWLLEKEGRG